MSENVNHLTNFFHTLNVFIVFQIFVGTLVTDDYLLMSKNLSDENGLKDNFQDNKMCENVKLQNNIQYGIASISIGFFLIINFIDTMSFMTHPLGQIFRTHTFTISMVIYAASAQFFFEKNQSIFSFIFILLAITSFSGTS